MSTPRPSRSNGELIIVALFVALVMGALWYALSERQQALRSSRVGMDGLQVWLASEGVSAQSFSGGWLLEKSTIGLMIIPLYDTELGQERSFPSTKEDLLFQQDENDRSYGPLLRKARQVQTLVVLPKWRSGVRLTGLGHPVLAVEKQRIDKMLQTLTGDPGAQTAFASTPFTEFDYTTTQGDTKAARIYAARGFKAQGCKSILSHDGVSLLADCPLEGDEENRVLILSDPDLMNNHGLRLGDNAHIALDLLRSRADDKLVLIDYSSRFWLNTERAPVKRERTWSDLMRFFEPPFLALWIGGVLTLALFLWRAAKRYGPVRPHGSAQGASKALAIEARARLMRLSGQNGAMLRDYAKARISATAANLFGPAHVRQYSGEAAFLRYAYRRHPAHADRLEAVLSSLHDLPARIHAADAIRYVDDLEDVLERITHDT